MKIYKFNDDVMFADVADGMAIVINNETGVYYGFNEFATEIFEQLRNGASIEEIISELEKMPNVPQDIVSQITKFAQDLEDKNIFSSAEGNGTKARFNSDIAISNNYELSFQEYTDAQEMLLADPVHEVKEETGWTPEKDSIGYTKEETLEREKKMKEE